MNKKILIIGNSASTYALAKKLSENNDIYVAPGNDTIKEFATCIDIRKDSVAELLEFAMETGIDMTIPVSKTAIKTNIVEIFNKNNLQIFAPSYNSAKPILDKAQTKKILYKLRIPTPKFGIFEKQNMAVDYIKNLKTPFVIKTNESSSAMIFTNAKTSKNIVDSLFAIKNQKLIIEDYVWGSPFTFYTITDGYKALPIGSSLIYKHSLEGDGGQLTNGMGCCSPNYKLSIENEYFLMDNVIYPLLEYLDIGGNPYTGILGINAVLTDEGIIQVLGFENFMQDCDCTSILELLDEDILKLMEACAIGSFSDEVDFINTKDMSATSLILTCKNRENAENVITGLDEIDEDILTTFYPNVTKNKYLEFEANSGEVLGLTAISRTTTTSTSKVYNEAKNINFKGISYRKDICKPCRIID